jgi:flagellum-specific peptidoglycan hydrolase FlgJ
MILGGIIMSLAPDQLAFIEEAVKDAALVQTETGIIVSGQVAQACLESAFGRKKPGLNCYGIKIHKCPYVLGTQQFTTHEVSGSKSKVFKLGFATYATLVDCFRCHALILKKNFPTAYAAKTVEDYAKFLHYDPATRLSYATDPNYEKSIITVVNSHNLRQYDKNAANT